MSLRNALHRRNHKERAQLTGRSRLGLLEKKKDYVQRAKDYHSKQERIHRLQEKAAMRNKDEFYFSMINSRTKVIGFFYLISMLLIRLPCVGRKGFTSKREAMLLFLWIQ